MQSLSQRSVATRPPLHDTYQPDAKSPQPQSRPGLFAGEPITCRRDAWQFAEVMLHLALLLAVVNVYHLENRAFVILATIAAATLPVHYLTPFRWKKPLFIAASMLGLAWVYGPVVAGAVALASAVMIGVCYLPIPWIARAGLMGSLALALALTRPAEGFLGVIPAAAWPVLATMFMFRMIIFLYELKHAKKREPVVDVLGYFFLLPNYCFLHFPVVDYRTLQRSYFSKDVHDTQRAGLKMMTKGALQLLLYRLVYHELLIPAEEVRGPVALAGFLFCNYLLYLRVSGQFHMACGMLHLFGFQLPETHHNYLLATGFTDYWRRINIYWKDFMVRVVFNPVVFRLKRWPQPAALAIATAVVFFATWALHAYQSYWLRGSWGFSLPDALFWGILGLLVMVNVQFDARRPRRRAAKDATPTLAERGLRWLKVAGTLTTITVLWSLWSSPSVSAWVDLFRRGLTVSM
ncbi:hypothetical protein [Singulisphaera sp. PoT]|uniref:hypothetical protein n=1 Tax=Singulisphaera sp. PoT TaxID=3411797 RepID=UPI003BF5E8EF